MAIATLGARLKSLWRNLAHRSRVDSDLDEELRSALEMALDEKLRAGVPLEDARRAAAAELGPLDSIRHQVREARTGAFLDTLAQDLRHGLRRLAHEPLFTLFAVLSLALGIGANTAIFSLWNGLLHSPLPGVREPEQLVILSNPDRGGSWTGRWDRTGGPRPWLSHDEFQDLRAHARSFVALMASQTSISRFRVRFETEAWEEASGRLVSDGFFDVLGADAAVGRLFTQDVDEPTAIVISHRYWQRRFAGRPDVLGRTLIVRETPFRIIGVAARGFIGETAGQQPDVWVPLRSQPLVLPFAYRLHDTPPEKSMFLHVFGRLKPGVTLAQADAEANAIFRAGLESFYGILASGDRRHEFLDQVLKLRPAARGASNRRADLSPSLTALMAAVGVLLLIACANLSTLLLARGAARRPEMALRLSLGATRGRLVRQMLTESMAIALFGGVAAVAVASAFHGGLVRMLARSDSHFRIAFALDPQVVAFLVGASLATSVLFGLLPAWQVTRTEAGAGLREESRGAVGWLGQQRSGRTLVGVQLALSLPLLVGAGLLARTVRNLEHADLGFPSERLLLVRVDLRDAGYDAARRESFVRELLGEIGRIPGVSAVSFSQLGLFTGGESACAIAVEGHEPAGDDDRSSARDAVGPGYFSTLGMHVVLGREVDFGDASGAPGSCVVNQGFVRRFVGGRDPIGLRITEFEEDAAPTWSCLIVGVVRDARTQDLRESIEPRYFVPGLQAPPRLRSPTFLIRMSAGATGVMAAVRKEVERIDAGLPILSARTLYEQMSPQTAQERTTAQLAAAFGCVALVLAAIGLYGVLSHGIARRTREIAVRIALGARPGTVVWMILRETAGVVAAGLAAGLVLTWAGSSAVHGLLYGVAPRDPLTLAAAAGLLLLVALCAAYAPAGRASRLDPMAALRQE